MFADFSDAHPSLPSFSKCLLPVASLHPVGMKGRDRYYDPC